MSKDIEVINDFATLADKFQNPHELVSEIYQETVATLQRITPEIIDRSIKRAIRAIPY